MGTRRIDFHEEYLIIARRTCRRRGKIHLLWRQVIHFRCGYLARDRAENIFRLSGLRLELPLRKRIVRYPWRREYDPSTGSHKSRYTKRANGRYHNDPIKR